MTKKNFDDIFTKEDVKCEPERLCYIPWEVIEEKLWDEYKQFNEWMRWQTCVEEWAYASDVRNYFYRRDRGQLDWLPHWF